MTITPPAGGPAPRDDHDEPAPAPWGIELAPGINIIPGAIRFRAVRSPGPGGQNVNKRSTKVELRIGLDDIPLAPGPRARLRAKAARFLTDDGEILITSSENRSQAQNKEACLDRLRSLVAAALVPPKVRRPTKVTKASKARRVDAKSRRGKVKRLRQQRPDHGD